MAEAFWALLSQKNPTLQIRKGLLITGIHGDSLLSLDPTLTNEYASTSFARLQELINSFRDFGHVIWVRSGYDPGLEIKAMLNSPTPHEYSAAVYDQPNEAEVEGDGDSPVPTKRPRISSEEADTVPSTKALVGSTKDSEIGAQNEEPSSMDHTTTRGVRTSFADRTRFSIDTLIDAKKDIQITKTEHSAFQSTPLVNLLRSKLIMELFVCGAATDVSVRATAMAAAQNGIKINLVEDCLVGQNKEKHHSAIDDLRHVMGAVVTTSHKVVHLLRNPPPTPDSEERDYAEECDNEYDEECDDEFDEEYDCEADRFEFEHSEENLAPAAQFSGGLQEIEVDSEEESDDEDSMFRPLSSHLHERIARMRFGSPASPLDETAFPLNLTSTIDSEVMWKRMAAEYPHPPANTFQSVNVENRSNIKSISETTHLAQKKPDNSIEPQRAINDKQSDAGESSRAVSLEDVGSITRWIGLDLGNSEEAPSSSKHPGLNAFASICGLSQKTVDQYEKLMAAAKQEQLAAETRSLESRPLFGDDKAAESARSCIVYDLLPPALAETIFDQLKAEVTWQRMYHQTGEVPRLVCCQGTLVEDSMPVYRHPSDRTLPTQSWTPSVDKVCKIAEEAVGHTLNHVLIQLYRGGTDFISEHSDKTLDIVEDSFIVNVSFGAQRTMRLRTKRAPVNDQEAAPSSRTTYRVPMPHNSMIKMSLATNAEYLHGINADKRPAVELSEAETGKAFGRERISLTFRNIGTFLNLESTHIWGQGATAKSREHANHVINGDALESERLVHAFGAENQATSIQWDANYGSGFDVLHLK